MTSEPAAEAIGRGYGANVLVDDREDGQSAATLIGIAVRARARARRASCSSPATRRRSTPPSSTRLLDRPRDRPSVVIVPDRHGTGTNALLLTPPTSSSRPSAPTAVARHEQAAAARRRPVHDVDGGRDARARRRHPGRPRRAAQRSPTAAAAPRTRAGCSAGSTGPSAAGGASLIAPRAARHPRGRAGDDLAPLLAGPPASRSRGGDVLVVAHKVVSKAEGRVVRLADVEPGERALRARRRARQGPAPRRGDPRRERRDRALRAGRADLPHAPRLRLRERGRRRVQRAGGGSSCCCRATPTPRPARCARRLRDAAGGVAPAVVIADSSAAPGATGQCDVAIGIAGLRRRSTTGAGAPTPPGARSTRRSSRSPTRRRPPPTSRGSKDSREPAVLVRGLERYVTRADGPGAAALLRAPRARTCSAERTRGCDDHAARAQDRGHERARSARAKASEPIRPAVRRAGRRRTRRDLDDGPREAARARRSGGGCRRIEHVARAGPEPARAGTSPSRSRRAGSRRPARPARAGATGRRAGSRASTSIATPMNAALAIVPSPGGWRSGIHSRMTANETAIVAVPTDSGVCLLTPSESTVHGELPRRAPMTIPLPRAEQPQPEPEPGQARRTGTPARRARRRGGGRGHVRRPARSVPRPGSSAGAATARPRRRPRARAPAGARAGTPRCRGSRPRSTVPVPSRSPEDRQAPLAVEMSDHLGRAPVQVARVGAHDGLAVARGLERELVGPRRGLDAGSPAAAGARRPRGRRSSTERGVIQREIDVANDLPRNGPSGVDSHVCTSRADQSLSSTAPKQVRRRARRRGTGSPSDARACPRPSRPRARSRAPRGAADPAPSGRGS